MPFELDVPAALQRQGWKVKIRERERVEPPHVTIIRRTKTWRYGLRGGGFLDVRPSPRDVPAELVAHVDARLADLRAAWDAMYPENPVGDDR